jgi:hypothetical protein
LLRSCQRLSPGPRRFEKRVSRGEKMSKQGSGGGGWLKRELRRLHF